MQPINQTTESNLSYFQNTEDDQLVNSKIENLSFQNFGSAQKKSEFIKLKMNFMGGDAAIQTKTL